MTAGKFPAVMKPEETTKICFRFLKLINLSLLKILPADYIKIWESVPKHEKVLWSAPKVEKARESDPKVEKVWGSVQKDEKVCQ